MGCSDEATIYFEGDDGEGFGSVIGSPMRQIQGVDGF